jgi:hypothetical protein
LAVKPERLEGVAVRVGAGTAKAKAGRAEASRMGRTAKRTRRLEMSDVFMAAGEWRFKF